MTAAAVASLPKPGPAGVRPFLSPCLAPVLALALQLAAFPVVPAAAAETEPMVITARQISQFRNGSDETRFGPLEFVGGLELSSRSRNFGGMSAIRFVTPGSDFIGVTDTGFWFFGRLDRDGAGRPAGFADFRMQPMVDRSGTTSSRKWDIDAEGLAVRAGEAIVGFEHDHRIARFEIDPAAIAAAAASSPIGDYKGEIDFLVPRHELRRNRGFETVAHAADGPLAGALVVVSEKSLDRSGNIFAAILDGPHKGVFTVRRSGEFDITDGAFLPDGDLLLLERSFTLVTGVRMRLRRIEAASMTAGGAADGPILFEADMGFQIDNMEGLEVWRRDDGALMVAVISDDNHSILQRNLYLEFVLHQD